MKMFDANSTLIARYGYDPKSGELDIEFHSGGTWRYSGVRQDAFTAFLQAPSKGKYFLANIKLAYEATRL